MSAFSWRVSGSPYLQRSGTQNIRLPQLWEQWKRKRSQAADGKSIQAINSKYTHHVCKVKKKPKDLLTAENQVRATCLHGLVWKRILLYICQGVKQHYIVYTMMVGLSIHVPSGVNLHKTCTDQHKCTQQSALVKPLAVGCTLWYGRNHHNRVLLTAKRLRLFSFFISGGPQ